MSQDNRARLKQWLDSGEARLQPLTFPQRELWEASPVPVADAANHICAFIQVRGSVTPRDVEVALRQVVGRQEVLRLSFLPGKSQPLQMIRATGEPVMQFRELSSSQQHPEAVEELMAEIFREPFDLVRGPLYRVEMLQRGPDDIVLAFAIHHAIADGWTLGVFVQDLVAAYLLGKRGDRDPLPPVPLTHSAWGAAERTFWDAKKLEQRAAFWKPRLAGAGRLWDAPATAQTGSRTLRRWVSLVPAEPARAVREVVRQTGATLFSTLLAAFQITLARWTGREDIVVGTPVANRSKQAVRETMGYFSDVVPLRGEADRDRPFAESVRAVHRSAVASCAKAMPFAELARTLGAPAAPGHNSVFDVRFALQNHPIPEVALPGLSAKLSMRSTGTARFDLGCEITEDDAALEVVWLFRPELFSQADVEDLDRMFLDVLTRVCRAPESRTAALTT